MCPNFSCSVFNIVRFPNAACLASSGENGTCLTAAECSSRGGSVLGSCAVGFGSCCVVTTSSCGGRLSSSSPLLSLRPLYCSVPHNCTYLTNPGHPAPYTEAGTCTWTFPKCQEDVCQIRLDYDIHTISGILNLNLYIALIPCRPLHHPRDGVIHHGGPVPHRLLCGHQLRLNFKTNLLQTRQYLSLSARSGLKTQTETMYIVVSCFAGCTSVVRFIKRMIPIWECFPSLVYVSCEQLRAAAPQPRTRLCRRCSPAAGISGFTEFDAALRRERRPAPLH